MSTDHLLLLLLLAVVVYPLGMWLLVTRVTVPALHWLDEKVRSWLGR